MPKGRRLTTDRSIAQWVKEGRGSGEGIDYMPWLTIQDVPSRGRCHRVKGWKHGRVHHLLSDLEYYVFLIFEWARRVIDIREQFPLLPLEETLHIAERIGVRHPTDPRTRHPVVMTTDMLLTVSVGLQRDYVPIAVKYEDELLKPRVLEKLEIERLYWEARGKVLGIPTERRVPTEFVRNVRWFHKYRNSSALYPLTEDAVDQIADLLTRTVLETELPLRVITSASDRRLGLSLGTSLAVVRHLLASRRWEVDMTRRIRTDERLVLVNFPRSENLSEVLPR
jgi:hypothetical protein